MGIAPDGTGLSCILPQRSMLARLTLCTLIHTAPSLCNCAPVFVEREKMLQKIDTRTPCICKCAPWLSRLSKPLHNLLRGGAAVRLCMCALAEDTCCHWWTVYW